MDNDNKALADRLDAAWQKLYADGDEHGVCEVIAEAEAALREPSALSPQADKARGEVVVPDGLIDALRRQRQVDEDGSECGVSRQAVDETIEILEALTNSKDAPRRGAMRRYDIVYTQWGAAIGLKDGGAYVRYSDLTAPQPQGDASGQPAFNMDAESAHTQGSVAQVSGGGEVDRVASTIWDCICDENYVTSKCLFDEAHTDDQEAMHRIAIDVIAAMATPQARPDGGAVVAMLHRPSNGDPCTSRVVDPFALEPGVTAKLYTHPAPAPDVALVEFVRASVRKWEECKSPLAAQEAMFAIANTVTVTAAQQEEATNGQE